MSSRQTEVEQQFPPAATHSIFDVVPLPPALAYTPLSLSVYVRSVKTDQGECIGGVCAFARCARQPVRLAPEQCPLDPVWQNPAYRFPNTPRPFKHQ